MCVSEHITRIAAGLDCFYSEVLVCRSHSKRGNEAEIKRKMPTGPEDKKRPWQRQRGREREARRCLSGGSPSSVSPLTLSLFPPLAPSYPLPCTPTHPSPLSAALCWLFGCFLVPIRPIALCFHQTQHLSYHCLDNCLLVQKSLWALCSHGDDMVTLPGGSAPPAETVDHFPLLLSPSVFLFAHPFASFFFSLPCSSFGSSPPTRSLGLPTLWVCVHGCMCVWKHACVWTTDGEFSTMQVG